MGDLLRVAEAADGDLRQQLLALRLGQLVGHHRGLDVGRRDAVDRDSGGRRLPGQGQGQRGQAALGGAVGRARGQAAGLGGQGADVDDAAPALGLHRRQPFARQVEGAVQVDRHHPAPLLGRGLRRLVVRQDAGVVHQDVDLALLRADPVAGRRHRPRVRDVERQRPGRRAEADGDLLQAVLGDVEHHDLQARLDQGRRNRGPQHAGRAGDQRAFAVQCLGHASVIPPGSRSRSAWPGPGPGRRRSLRRSRC